MGITVARTRYLEPPGTQWPDETTTGVPSGTSLTTHNGDLETTTNGQTIDAQDIVDGSLVIEHDNVTVTRCRIDFVSVAAIYIAPGVTGLVVEDCELTGGPGTALYYEGDEGTFRRLYIHGPENGIHIGANGITLEDSYITDLDWPEPAHADGVQCSPGTGNVVITGCNFDMAGGISGGIQLEAQAAPVAQNFNWLVEGNRVVLYANEPDPGAVTIRLPQEDVSGSNVRFRNNRLMPGEFGAVQFQGVNGAITEWSGNVYDDTGDPVDLP